MVLNRCKIYNKAIEELYDGLIDYDGHRVYDAASKLYDLEYAYERTNCKLFKHYAIEMSYERWRLVFEAAKNAQHLMLENELIYDVEDVIDNLITRYPRYMQRFNEATERLLDWEL